MQFDRGRQDLTEQAKAWVEPRLHRLDVDQTLGGVVPNAPEDAVFENPDFGDAFGQS